MTRKTAIASSIRGLLSFTLACLLVAGCNSKPSAPPVSAAQPGAAATGPAPGGQPPVSIDPALANEAPAGSQPNQIAQPAQPNAGQNQAGPQPVPQSTSPRQPPAQALVIPAGTVLRVRLDQTLSSRRNQPGDTFSATVESPVVVHGVTLINRGSTASGTVVDAKALGRVKGEAILSIRLDRIRAGGRSYLVSTSSIERIEKGKGKRTGAFAGGGAGLGAIIGGLAGGGKGALIGGLAGGGAGTAAGTMTGNKDLELPAETMLTFRTTRSVRVE